jgi:hypothetical protein
MEWVLFFNFKTYNLDRLIILALKNGNGTTIDIKEYLSNKNDAKHHYRIFNFKYTNSVPLGCSLHRCK